MVEELTEVIKRSKNNETLKKNGWKVLADNTVLQMSKKELLEYVRMLEHNWACALIRHENTIKYIERSVEAQGEQQLVFGVSGN
jgi:hypothetical protein